MTEQHVPIEWTPAERVFLDQGRVIADELFLQAEQAIELIAKARQLGEAVLGLETFLLKQDGPYPQLAVAPHTEEVSDILNFLDDLKGSDYWFTLVLGT